jgi:hypothetical protein
VSKLFFYRRVKRWIFLYDGRPLSYATWCRPIGGSGGKEMSVAGNDFEGSLFIKMFVANQMKLKG